MNKREKDKWEISRSQYLSGDEANHLLTTVSRLAGIDRRKKRRQWVVTQAVVHCALGSGLRCSELANLRIGDISPEDTEARLFVRRGKNGKSRHVYIDPELWHLLQRFIDWKKANGEPTGDEDYLFSSKRSPKFHQTALRRIWIRAVTTAGLENGKTIHCSRHSLGSRLLAVTKDIEFVRRQLGHSSVQATSVYLHCDPEAAMQAVTGLWKIGGK